MFALLFHDLLAEKSKKIRQEIKFTHALKAFYTKLGLRGSEHLVSQSGDEI